MDNDFIEDPFVGGISGFVYDDQGTPMLSVEITLYPADTSYAISGAAIATTYTASNGYYIFTGVEPGYYLLVETQQIPYSSVSDRDTSINAGDLDGDDSADGPDNNIPVRLIAGEADEDNNFENGRPGSICGSVRDDTGAPISNVTIELYYDDDGDGEADAGAPLATTTSDGDSGNYCFEDLEPRDYVVVEEQPDNYDDVSDIDESTGPFDPDGDDDISDPDDDIPVTLAPGEADEDNNFVEDPYVGEISGYVYDDAGTPMVGISISLYTDPDTNGVADVFLTSTSTSGSGYYQFTGIEPGPYVLEEFQTIPYSSVSDRDTSINATDLDGDDSADGPDNDIPVLLSAGEEDEDNNFENGRPGTICGSVRDDLGAPISNVVIELYYDNDMDGEADPGMLVATTMSDGDSGNFCFEDLEPRHYVIVEQQPTNYNSLYDFDQSTGAFDPDGNDSLELADNDIPVLLAPAESDMDNDFVEDPFTGAISGRVYDENGIGMVGIDIELYMDSDSNGVADGAPIATTQTMAVGLYVFTGIEPGYYVLKEVQQIPYGSTSDYDHSIDAIDTDGDDSADGPDNEIPVIITPGEVDSENFFENGSPGSICGFVQDDNGAPISNVVIELYYDDNQDGIADVGGFVNSMLTDGDAGGYCFEDLEPRHYVLVEIQPDFYNDVADYDVTTDPPDTDGDDQADGADNDIPVILMPGETDHDNNFIEDPYTGSITGASIDDIGTGINGVTIELYEDVDEDGEPDATLVAWTTTSGDGSYTFTGVEPGSYVLVEFHPIPYSSVSDRDTSVNASDPDGDDSADGPDNNIPVVITPGEADADNLFVNGRPGTICGSVKDDTGAPISNVVIDLYADTNGDGIADGPVLYSRFSDGDSGGYCFEDITPGNYVIVETQPDFYNDVFDFDMSTGASDPDGNDSLQTPDNDIPVVLTPGESDLDNDFIEDPFTGSISGEVIDDIGIAMNGITVELFADIDTNGVADGIALQSTFTVNGLYVFNSVEPGYYVIVETQQLPYSSVSDYDTTMNAVDLDGDDSAQGPDDDIPVYLSPGEDDDGNIFVNGRPGTICGNVSDDLGNPISNVEVRLYEDINGNGELDDGAPLNTLMSDGDTGDYCFEDVTPGNYIVVQVQPDFYSSVFDYDFSPDPDGNDSIDGPDNEIPVTLTPGEYDLDNNFFEDPDPGQIAGQVVDDGGNPIADVTITLYLDVNGDLDPDGASMVDVTTNASGQYVFTGVEPGSYVILESQPFLYTSLADYDESPDPDGDDDYPRSEQRDPDHHLTWRE